MMFQVSNNLGSICNTSQPCSNYITKLVNQLDLLYFKLPFGVASSNPYTERTVSVKFCVKLSVIRTLNFLKIIYIRKISLDGLLNR